MNTTPEVFLRLATHRAMVVHGVALLVDLVTVNSLVAVNQSYLAPYLG